MPSVGTEFYGRVKSVQQLPIVTSFWMFNYIPILPRESWYCRKIKSEFAGVPLIASTERFEVDGIPLAKLDAASVVISYLRALGAVGLIISVLWSVMFVVMYLNPSPAAVQPDGFVYAVFSIGAIGTAVGGITYVIPLCSRRERRIRQVCHEVLGWAIDPAVVTKPMSQRLLAFINELSQASGRIDSTQELMQMLVVTRCRIAQGQDRNDNEARTTQILEELSSIAIRT